MTAPAASPRFDLPEFTRSLRGFASVKALGTNEHDLLFRPLLAARRTAFRVQSPEARVVAFDADRLGRSFRGAIAAIAKARSEGDAAIERALDARLEERAGPVFKALGVIGAAAASLKGGPGVTEAQWSAWCAAVQQLFDTTDDFWLAIDDVAPPGLGPARLLTLSEP